MCGEILRCVINKPIVCVLVNMYNSSPVSISSSCVLRSAIVSIIQDVCGISFYLYHDVHMRLLMKTTL
jgi:hypothetical protein